MADARDPAATNGVAALGEPTASDERIEAVLRSYARALVETAIYVHAQMRAVRADPAAVKPGLGEIEVSSALNTKGAAPLQRPTPRSNPTAEEGPT